jgi:D-3-phosphoglycerate dehydrogenase / 2-oxoglutarate reductase
MSASDYTVVLVGCEIPSDLGLERAVLAEAGATLVDLRSSPVADVVAQLVEADGILTEATDALTGSVIEQLHSVRVISVIAVGTDGVDVAAATRAGIPVTNVPGYCTLEVADHTVALALAAWRRLPAAERIARSGSWAIDGLQPVSRMSGRTCGLLGLGRISREVARRLQAFGFQVISHDPWTQRSVAEELDVEMVERDELFARSDMLSLHAPLTDDTTRIVDRRTLALMPQGAVLINVGRGGLVDYDDLLEALQSGHLAAAALDVFDVEPAPPDHPLLALSNVICTPHMAYYSEESLLQLRAEAARNVARALRGEPIASIVNPDVRRASRGS